MPDGLQRYSMWVDVDGKGSDFFVSVVYEGDQRSTLVRPPPPSWLRQNDITLCDWLRLESQNDRSLDECAICGRSSDDVSGLWSNIGTVIVRVPAVLVRTLNLQLWLCRRTQYSAGYYGSL